MQCANCGREIEKGELFYRCINDKINDAYFDGDEEANAFCSKECFADFCGIDADFCE